ncbi:MAG: response regulator [Gammaproteobacteria bacterium]|nr:response regulator [Gammaproteobacteria bacterium]
MESIDLLLNEPDDPSLDTGEGKTVTQLKQSKEIVEREQTFQRASAAVLVADDDSMVLFLAEQALTAKGFKVLTAADGQQALEIYQSKNPDLVLCDVMMPNLDGFELCSAIRRMKDGEHVPVVMLTGLNDARSIKQAFAIGATDYCEKPVNWDLLPFKIDYVLRASNAFGKLRASEERLGLFEYSISDGLWDWSFADDKIYYSARWKSMLGFGEDQIGTDPMEWIDRIHTDDKSRVINELHAHKNGESTHFECEYRIRDAEGDYRWVKCRGVAVGDENGVACRMTGSQTDISDLKAAEEALADKS